MRSIFSYENKNKISHSISEVTNDIEKMYN